ncbi:MAG: GAF domain-containing protein [Planctomycetes bacterium]|nr:GAF domain-containing protein [Planctomycetota bacterium]
MPRAPRKSPRARIGVPSLRRVLRILRVATSTLDPKVLFRSVVEAIQAEFPELFHVSIFLAFKGPNVFVPMALAGESPEVFVEKYPGGYTQNLEAGLLGQAWKTRSTYLSNDVRKDPNYLSAVFSVTRSELCVPIRVEEDVVAVMNFESRQKNAFPPEDVEFFEILADQLANAVNNSMIHEELASRGDQSAALSNAGTAVENSFRDIMDSLPAPILKVDARDCLAFVNRSATQLLGVQNAELDSKPFADLLDADGRRRWAEARGKTPAKGASVSLTLTWRDRTLTGVWQAFPVQEERPPFPILLKRFE